MKDFIKKIITPDMVSLWVPDGLGGAMDVIRGNQGTAYGTHPNVPVISTFQPPNLLTDGRLNEWDDENNLTHWTEAKVGNSTVNRESEKKVEGDYSCRLDVDAGGNTVYVSQTISLTPSEKHKLVLYYASSAEVAVASFQCRDTGAHVYLKEDGTWAESSYSIEMPYSATLKRFKIEFSGHPDYSRYTFILGKVSDIVSSIYWDGVSIEELKPSLINPSVGWVFGGDDHVKIPQNSSLQFSGNFTFGIYFRVASHGQYDKIVRNIGSSCDFYIQQTGAYPDDDIYLYVKDDNGNVDALGLPGPLDDSWHRVIVVINGVYFEAYIDGQFHSKVDARFDAGFTFGDWYLGRNHNETFYLHGSEALPFVARGAWSAAQVKNDWLNTRSLFSPRG